MAVLIASLGFAWHHVVMAASRCGPRKIVLVTVSPDLDRVRNAIEEVKLYGKSIKTPVETVVIDAEDFWECVERALPLFDPGVDYCLDLGGGVRALSLCLLTAAVLAVQLAGLRIKAVYTMAEHRDTVVEADLRPLLYSAKLAKGARKKKLLRSFVESGAQELDRYGKNVAREFESYGLLSGGSSTPAAKALYAALKLGRRS